MYEYLKGKDVRFVKGIEDMESYPEPGMMATIIDVDESAMHYSDPKERVLKIRFSYEKYDAQNLEFESANYYDKNHRPCLTARQANYYTVEESIYFGCPSIWPFSDYFEILNGDEISDLVKLFDEREDKSVRYVTWLETELLKRL